MAIKIDSPIVGCEVVGDRPGAGVHEALERPEALEGTTYKLKTPLSEHALYITINDVSLPDGSRQPFEIFINSKNMEHFQWIIALTRIISAVFRKGGETAFLVEELRSVFDPKAGYFKQGRWMPSLVAEIGDVIEQHLRKIGAMEARPGGQAAGPQESEAAENEAEARPEQTADGSSDGDPWPREAVLCPKCQNRSLVKSEGCLTCLNCGDSKCS